MASELLRKNVKVYAQGGFAVGVCIADYRIDGERRMEVRTHNAIAYIENPGIIFVEDEVEFPKIED